MVVVKFNDTIYEIFMDELNSLELGHPFNTDRLSYLRSYVTLLLYLDFACLNDSESWKILELYKTVKI